MKTMRNLLMLLVGMLLAIPAWAGNVPEFDAVGCDNMNFFAISNAAQHQQVIQKNIGPNGPINLLSKFNDEMFRQSAGQMYPDPCFDIDSALTDVWNEAVYEWTIVLQMKPESDINLNIYDCVLKHNEFEPFMSAEQTGRYRASWGQLMFVPSANPSVTALAYPGPYATPGFRSPFNMDYRALPGLQMGALDDVLYTSKGLWDEGIVMALPETGKRNCSGQTTYNLKDGDKIYVVVTIPANNTADIRYGAESVMLKYVGIYGTWLYGNPGLQCN